MAESFRGTVPGQDAGFAEVHERSLFGTVAGHSLTASFNETSALGM
jgi:hypothetical protein